MAMKPIIAGGFVQTPAGGGSAYNPAAVAITGGTINGVYLGAVTPDVQHILRSTAGGTPNFDSANVVALRHEGANGASAVALQDTSGNERGAMGFKINGPISTYLNGAVYLAGGAYDPTGTMIVAGPTPVIIGQEGYWSGVPKVIARLRFNNDWTVDWRRPSDDGIVTTLKENGDWSFLQQVHINIPTSTTLFDVNGIATVGGPTGSAVNRNADSTHDLNVIGPGANKIRIIKEGIVKADIQINGTGGTRRLDFVDSDNSSIVPLSVSLAGTGDVTVAGKLVFVIPTSNPGPGTLWNNAGTLTVGS